MAGELYTRRQSLTGLAAVSVAAVAGCLTADGGPDSTQSGDPLSFTSSLSAGGATPSPTPIPDRRISDLSVTGLSDVPVSITPTVAEAEISTERTARFHLAVEANGEDSVSVWFGSQIPFSSPQESTPAGIVLLVSGPEYARRNQRTWLPDTEKGDSIYAPSVVMGADLAPGETVTGPWEVWADPDHASSIATGTFEFENTLTFPGESTNETVEWVLSATIED